MQRVLSLIVSLAMVLAPLPCKASRSFGGSAYLTNATGIVDVPFTVSLWFNTNSTSTTQTMFIVAAANDDGHYLLFRGATTGAVAATSNDAGVASGEATTGAAGITSGTWYHAGGVWASSGDRRVFLNGTKFTNSTNVAPTGISRTTIGAFYGGTPIVHFNGLIAECGVWNVALSDEEMAALARGRSPLRVRPQNLVEYWPLVGNGTNESGVKGNVLTNTSSTKSELGPRIYR